jgi:uncharacterized SAM-binding protein YcdF (DUF218 family)
MSRDEEFRMLQSVINVLKGSLRPGSIFMCLLLVLAGVLLLYMRGGTKLGRRWLIAVIAGYWTISTPLGARLLMRGLIGGYTPVQSPSEVPAASAIVVLSGGSFTYRTGGLALDVLSEPTALRALEAARLYRLLGDPLVVASGGAVFPADNPDPESQALGKALVSLGIPQQRIVYESLSRNTLEQAARSKDILQARHIDHFVLVTSAVHMRRSMAVFRAAGLSPYPSASRVRSEGLSEGWPFLPQQSSLSLSDDAIYDYLALGYYWARGRM